MNNLLLEQIIKHIFANFVIIPSDFVNLDKTKSLLIKDYLLDKKICFKEDDIIVNNNIWGCQISSGEQFLKILVANCSINKSIPEYCMLINLEKRPIYGMYLVCSDKSNPNLSCSLNGSEWITCNTFLQGTFLAGMENIKELNFNWNKCSNYDEEYKMIKSYITYYNGLEF